MLKNIQKIIVVEGFVDNHDPNEGTGLSRIGERIKNSRIGRKCVPLENLYYQHFDV